MTESAIRFSGHKFESLLASQAEMSLIDKKTIDSTCSSLELMERAASVVAETISPYLSKQTTSILCGPGNNGGDGLALARILKSQEKATLCLISKAKTYSSEFLHQLKLSKAANVELLSIEIIPAFQTKIISQVEAADLLKNSSLIVDCLLGTGQQDAPRGGILDLLKLIPKEQSADRLLISVDIPTGVNGDTGEIYEGSVIADMTICIELVKRGLVQYPARLSSGHLTAKSIGLELNSDSTKFSVNIPEIPALIKTRNPASHKGNYGSVLTIGGSKEMPGAPILASHAALVSGAGLVKVLDIGEFENLLIPSELIKVSLEKSSHYTENHLKETLREIDKSVSIAIGFGIGLKESSKEFCLNCINYALGQSKQLVVDADALTFLSQDSALLAKLDQNVILTPHPGEMGRLLGVESQEVQTDRYQAVETLREKTNATIVLKGASTIVFDQGKGVVNLTGTPYMASPGSGDVLAGIIAAYLAQGIEPFKAACLAVYIHGLAGERAASAFEDTPVLASELIGHIRSAFSSYRDSKQDD